MISFKTETHEVYFGDRQDSFELCESYSKKRPLCLSHQVHGNQLTHIPSSHDFQKSLCLLEDSDGLYTSSRALALGLVTADCVPLFLIQDAQLFSLHLGWRSLHKGLLSKALERLSKDLPTYAYIGPHIHQDSFEVQNDFVEAFESFEPNRSLWLKETKDGLFVSLEEVIKNELKGLKRIKIQSAEVDTFKETSHFSYRRESHTKGRNLSFAFLK